MPVVTAPQQRAAQIVTQAMSQVTGPATLAVRMNDCRTESERVGVATATHRELWLAYSVLARRLGEVQARAEEQGVELDLD
jgi:hypothetical protein